MNPLLKEREVGFHLSDSGAAALRVVPVRRGRAGGRRARRRGVRARRAREVRAGVGAAEPVADVAERADERHRPDPLHLRHDGHAEGRGADPRQPARGRADLGRPRRLRAGDRDVRRPPLFHVFGLTSGLLSCVRVGGMLTLLPRFDPGKALEIVQRDRVNTFLGVPTMYAALLHHPERGAFDASSLELCVSGGAAMPVELLRGFEAEFDCKVLEGYGLSESCAIATFNRPDRERKPGSIGLPVTDTELKLADDDGHEVPEGEVGEILMRGPTVMKGYWDRADATATRSRTAG